MAQDPSLAETILTGITSHMHGVYVCAPGKVVKYYPDHADGAVADIELMCKIPLPNEDDTEVVYLDHPVLPEVPVAVLSGAGFFVAVGLEPGDPVAVHFSDVATGEYLTNGEKAEPRDTRRHSAGYPYCVPGGFRPAPRKLADVPSDGVIIGKDGTNQQIKVDAAFIELGKGAVDFVALASKVETELGKIAAAFNNHVHADPASGFTGTPQIGPSPAEYSPAPVAATLVKAK